MAQIVEMHEHEQEHEHVHHMNMNTDTDIDTDRDKYMDKDIITPSLSTVKPSVISVPGVSFVMVSLENHKPPYNLIL